MNAAIRGGVGIYLRVRSALAIAAAMVLTIGTVSADAAQSARGDGYPNRPIRYVVGGSVGGGADSLARAIGQKLGEQWGQQVIVENRPGGGGIVASEIVAKSPPDGHTLLMAFTSHVTNPSLYPSLSYDAVKDFAPITLIATMVSILPQVKSGKLRALAVTGARRSAAAPELPTISEAGVPGYEANAWFATFAAAETPAACGRRCVDARILPV